MPPSGPHRRRRPPHRAWSAVGSGALLLTLVAAGCGGATTDTTGAASPSTPPATSATAAPSTSATGPSGEDVMLTASPDEHSEVGTVVEGFPVDLLPLPPDAVILVTTAVPVGDDGLQEVSLNVRTSATAISVLDLYRAALLAAEFTEVPVESTGLAAESTFIRSGGDELVSIGVLDEEGLRTVTIGGRVRTTP